MASYLNVTFNHFSALQKWITETGAAVTLNMQDLTMEVKHRGRYFRMYPMFQAQMDDGSPMHVRALTPQVTGFGGWRPYQTFTHPHSTDKKLFKQHLSDTGIPTPARWDDIGTPPDQDYVLKARQGSFGLTVFGPYRANTPPAMSESERVRSGPAFAEQFVQGRSVKVWYWGARPFFAHVQGRPVIVGDGRSTAGELLQARVAQCVGTEAATQLPFAVQCLAYQQVGLDDVLAAGAERWIDYRFGQQYPTTGGRVAESDNQLDELLRLTGPQLGAMGNALARLLQQTVPVPVMLTADGVLDDAGTLWWLEMNTNSLLPPEGYAAMFGDLFG